MQLPLTDSLKAIEQVSVWLLALKLMLDLEELTQERLHLTRMIVLKGLAWLNESRANLTLKGGFISSFREIAVNLFCFFGRPRRISSVDTQDLVLLSWMRFV